MGMKVWIVLGCDPHEGYDDPLAAFDSEDKALNFCTEYKKKPSWDRYEHCDIFEMEIQ